VVWVVPIRAGANAPADLLTSETLTGAPIGILQKLDQQLPLSLKFRDEYGSEQPLLSYFGQRPVVLVPAYYRCPMLCGQLLLDLAGSLKGMSLNAGVDYQIVVVSFDPTDTPAQARLRKEQATRRYRRIGVPIIRSTSGWHFLTGDEAAIRALMDSLGYRYAYDPKSRQYAHPAGLVILTPDGRISRYLPGVDFAPRELRLSLVQASFGKIGSPLDRLLLFCYHYDPLKGRYGSKILRALHLSGLLTLLALLSLIAMLLWTERQRERR
jgi:protein SCO1/2